MIPIIVVTNRKGGVGKSTMSTHIAAGLATLGYRIGLIDTDSQGHASLMLGLLEQDGLFNAMINKAQLEQVVMPVAPEQYSTSDNPSQGALYLLPSSERTYQIPFMLKPDESFLFLQLVEAFAENYALDAILIDTSPTMSALDSAIYLAADGFIYVTECEMLSFDGVQKAIEQMQRFATQRKMYLNRESRVIGVIPNKMRPDTRNHRHNIKMLAQRLPGLVWSPITLRTIWTEATNSQELIYTYAPSGQEARDAWALVEQVRGVIETWQAIAE